MADLDILTLQNNKDYIVIDTLINEEKKYLFLLNKEDDNDMVVRKVIKKDDGEYVTKLDSEDEFEEIMYLFKEKHKGDENEE